MPKTSFSCELCSERIIIDKNDPKTYASIREEQNLLMGQLFIVRSVHESGQQLHFNVIVVDGDGQYRAHQDSYAEALPQRVEEKAPVPGPAMVAPTQKGKITPAGPPVVSKGKTLFLGRIAFLGQGGSGKTRAIQQIANELAGKELYPWSEEKNIA